RHGARDRVAAERGRGKRRLAAAPAARRPRRPRAERSRRRAVTARWTDLGAAGLSACALRVRRRDIAYFKYLFESYEGVAIVRTVETVDPATAVIAVLATPDHVACADEILPAVARAALPAVCREDWFLVEWVREPDDE